MCRRTSLSTHTVDDGEVSDQWSVEMWGCGVNGESGNGWHQEMIAGVCSLARSLALRIDWRHPQRNAGRQQQQQQQSFLSKVKLRAWCCLVSQSVSPFFASTKAASKVPHHSSLDFFSADNVYFFDLFCGSTSLSLSLSPTLCCLFTLLKCLNS